MSDRLGDAITRTLIGFSRALRGAGLPVGTGRTLAYCRAAAALGPRSLDDLYWAGRLALVSRHEDLQAYDHAFAAYFGAQGIGPEQPPAALRPAGGAGRVVLGPAAPDRQEMHEAHGAVQGVALTAASPAEVLRQKRFEEYTDEERALAAALIARLGAVLPRRRSRRPRPARRGDRPDLRRTLRRSLRTEGEPLGLAWLRRRMKLRRLVLVLDVSGSMGPYARPLAQFAHATVRSGAPAEVFAFGTRLTRVTPALRSPRPDAALAAVGAAIPDWQGGTRIGESFKDLLDRWGRRGPLRGALVIICSDGLERGEPDSLARQMRRLSRLAHRVIWVNPLKGSPRYEPLARGMAAALPYVDAFVPGHNLASLESLSALVGELGR